MESGCIHTHSFNYTDGNEVTWLEPKKVEPLVTRFKNLRKKKKYATLLLIFFFFTRSEQLFTTPIEDSLSGKESNLLNSCVYLNFYKVPCIHLEP